MLLLLANAEQVVAGSEWNEPQSCSVSLALHETPQHASRMATFTHAVPWQQRVAEINLWAMALAWEIEALESAVRFG